MRREERDRLVAPVVHAARRRILRIELKHRQQLHGRDAQVLQVRNLLDQAGVGPSLLAPPGAGMLGEAADVKLVDDRLGEGPSNRRIAFPVVARRDRRRRSSSRMRCCRRTASRRPGRRLGDGHGAAVRVEEQILAIEPESAFRRKRSVGAVGVDLPGLEIRNEDVPVVIRAMRFGSSGIDTRRLRGLHVVEQEQVDALGALRNTLKLTPPGPTVAPSGALVPVKTSSRRCSRVGQSRRSCTLPRASSSASTSQMSRQYSRIERSEENRPTRALLRIDMRVQSVGRVRFRLPAAGSRRTPDNRPGACSRRGSGGNPGAAGTARDRRPRRARSRWGRWPRAARHSIRRLRAGSPPLERADLAAVRPNRKKFSGPTASRISTLAPSSVPIVSAPFIANFMFPVPEASLPAARFVRTNRRRGRFVRLFDAEIRDEHHLSKSRVLLVLIDDLRHAIDQPDDQLGHVISRSRFAAEDHRPRSGSGFPAMLQPVDKARRRAGRLGAGACIHGAA